MATVDLESGRRSGLHLSLMVNSLNKTMLLPPMYSLAISYQSLDVKKEYDGNVRRSSKNTHTAELAQVFLHQLFQKNSHSRKEKRKVVSIKFPRWFTVFHTYSY